MSQLKLGKNTLPGLYQSADQASTKAQTFYFRGLYVYLLLLVLATVVSFLWPNSSFGAFISLLLFVITLIVLAVLRMSRIDDVWYNGRAVAESVKTRAWRWSMQSDPYRGNSDEAFRQFVDDLSNILRQNRSLSQYLQSGVGIHNAVSETMQKIRELPFADRLEVYRTQRIDDQAAWYAYKSNWNKKRANQWFRISCFLHLGAITLLIHRIFYPTVNLPVEVIATAASSVLTWLEAKKHNALNSSYSLAAHEIGIIQDEAQLVRNERDLSTLVINSETAFSREHTQWIARKLD